jgi:dihydrofolate reductase
MTALENIKNRLIDRILVTKNEQLLNAIDSIFNSTQTDEKLSLNSHQIEMLMMSENDIEQGNLISESDLKKSDSKWMN